MAVTTLIDHFLIGNTINENNNKFKTIINAYQTHIHYLDRLSLPFYAQVFSCTTLSPYFCFTLYGTVVLNSHCCL